MELNEIMRRIRLGDREALKELIARYGGGVYKRALAKTGDKALAKEITQKTFAELVTTLQKSGDNEGWQLWLDTLAGRNIDTCARIQSDVSYVKNEIDRELFEPASAEREAPALRAQPYMPAQSYAPREGYHAQPQHAQAYREPPYRGQPPRQQPPRQQPSRQSARKAPPEPPRHGFGYGFGVFVLILLCIVLLWAAAGICMNMGFLPKIDLGYTWFNLHVFQFF